MAELLLSLYVAQFCGFGCSAPAPVSGTVDARLSLRETTAQLDLTVNVQLAPHAHYPDVFAADVSASHDGDNTVLTAITLHGPDGKIAGALRNIDDALGDADAAAEEWQYGSVDEHDERGGVFSLPPSTGTPGPMLRTSHAYRATAFHVQSPAAFGNTVTFTARFLVRGKLEVSKSGQTVMRYALPDFGGQNVQFKRLRRTFAADSLQPPHRPSAPTIQYASPAVPEDETGPTDPYVDLPAEAFAKRDLSASASLNVTGAEGESTLFLEARRHNVGPLVSSPLPLAFVFVVDTSQSVEPESLAAAYRLITDTLAAAPVGSSFSVVGFDRALRVDIEAWRPAEERDIVKAVARHVRQRNGSEPARALALAQKMAADVPAEQRARIVFLSDFRQRVGAPLMGRAAMGDVPVAFIDIDTLASSFGGVGEGPHTRQFSSPTGENARDALATDAWLIEGAHSRGRAWLPAHLIAPRYGLVTDVNIGGVAVPQACLRQRDLSTDETWAFRVTDGCAALSGQTARPQRDGTLAFRTWWGMHTSRLPVTRTAQIFLAAYAIDDRADHPDAVKLSDAFHIGSAERSFFAAHLWRPQRRTTDHMGAFGCGGGCCGSSCVGCGGVRLGSEGSPNVRLGPFLNAMDDIIARCDEPTTVTVEIDDVEVLDVLSTDVTASLSRCTRDAIWAFDVDLLRGVPSGLYHRGGPQPHAGDVSPGDNRPAEAETP